MNTPGEFLLAALTTRYVNRYGRKEGIAWNVWREICSIIIPDEDLWAVFNALCQLGHLRPLPDDRLAVESPRLLLYGGDRWCLVGARSPEFLDDLLIAAREKGLEAEAERVEEHLPLRVYFTGQTDAVESLARDFRIAIPTTQAATEVGAQPIQAADTIAYLRTVTEWLPTEAQMHLEEREWLTDSMAVWRTTPPEDGALLALDYCLSRESVYGKRAYRIWQSPVVGDGRYWRTCVAFDRDLTRWAVLPRALNYAMRHFPSAKRLLVLATLPLPLPLARMLVYRTMEPAKLIFENGRRWWEYSGVEEATLRTLRFRLRPWQHFNRKEQGR